MGAGGVCITFFFFRAVPRIMMTYISIHTRGLSCQSVEGLFDGKL